MCACACVCVCLCVCVSVSMYPIWMTRTGYTHMGFVAVVDGYDSVVKTIENVFMYMMTYLYDNKHV